MYLDAGSDRLAKIPDAAKRAAEKWFEKNNPFEERRQEERKG
jgi:hypothetical protein